MKLRFIVPASLVALVLVACGGSTTATPAISSPGAAASAASATPSVSAPPSAASASAAAKASASAATSASSTSAVATTSAAASASGSAAAKPAASGSAAAGPSVSPNTALTGTIAVYGALTQDNADAFAKAFNAVAPNVKATMVAAGSGPLMTRITSEQQAGGVKADIILLADPTAMNGLAQQGVLADYAPKDAGQLPAALKGPSWYGAFTFN
ncbi:MAG: extracellular solute-binding protein, partial [Chloroflexi bacterium]|nr:extracellular solute-binding protein [Chloroflexota bacterium]